MPHINAEFSHVLSGHSWNSGGGVMLDLIELEGGLLLVVGEETISAYATADSFWAETEGGAGRSITTLLRGTGEVFAPSKPPRTGIEE